MSHSEGILEQVILFATALSRIGKVGKMELSYLEEANKLIDLEELG